MSVERGLQDVYPSEKKRKKYGNYKRPEKYGDLKDTLGNMYFKHKNIDLFQFKAHWAKLECFDSRCMTNLR